MFELKPPKPGKTAWTQASLHSFDGTDGDQPLGALVADGAGALYGTASSGGKTSAGVAFKLNP